MKLRLFVAGLMLAVLAMPAAATGPVATKPAAGTPQLVRTSGVQNIRQLVQCGTMMYAVGSFTEISQGGKNYSRNNVFSFSATAPYAVSGWNVNVNGNVNSIAFTSSNGCADAYIGGSFTSVHGTRARNIAEINTSTGSVVKNSSTFGLAPQPATMSSVPRPKLPLYRGDARESEEETIAARCSRASSAFRRSVRSRRLHCSTSWPSA